MQKRAEGKDLRLATSHVLSCSSLPAILIVETCSLGRSKESIPLNRIHPWNIYPVKCFSQGRLRTQSGSLTGPVGER